MEELYTPTKAIGYMNKLRTEQNPRELLLVRDIILKRNGYKSYEEFLNSDYWAGIKNKVKKSKYCDNYNHCSICKSTENINLHHENYRWLLTKYELRSIRALCGICHIQLHDLAYENDVTYSKAFELINNIRGRI